MRPFLVVRCQHLVAVCAVSRNLHFGKGFSRVRFELQDCFVVVNHGAALVGSYVFEQAGMALAAGLVRVDGIGPCRIQCVCDAGPPAMLASPVRRPMARSYEASPLNMPGLFAMR